VLVSPRHAVLSYSTVRRLSGRATALSETEGLKRDLLEPDACPGWGENDQQNYPKNQVGKCHDVID
jgi:hypothetical protein